jgi:hypothetical protein
MFTNIFSSVNPRWSDYLFAFFYPLGFNSLIYSIYILVIPVIIYIGSIWMYRHYLSDDTRKIQNVIFEILLIFFLSISNLILMGLLIAYLLSKSIKYKLSIKRNFNENRCKFKERTTPNNLKIYFITLNSILNSFILFVILPIGGFLIEYLMPGSNAYLISIGSILSIVFIFGRKTKKIPFFNSEFEFRTISKKKVLTILILIPLFSGSIFFTSGFIKIHESAPETNPSEDSIKLNLMTYNIRYGSANDGINSWVYRKDVFVGYLNTFDLDILCIQEAEIDQITYIVKNLENQNYKYTGFGRDDGVHGGEHSAILFDSDKFKFLDGDTFWLSDFPLFPSRTWGNGNYRVCTWARFEEKSTNSQFCIFNTHYDFQIISKEMHQN